MPEQVHPGCIDSAKLGSQGGRQQTVHCTEFWVLDFLDPGKAMSGADWWERADYWQRQVLAGGPEGEKGIVGSGNLGGAGYLTVLAPGLVNHGRTMVWDIFSGPTHHQLLPP